MANTPYRQQKKNRALAAREAGLQPLADWIWNCGHGHRQPHEGQTLELWAFTFRNEEQGRDRRQAGDQGAADILVERIAGRPAAGARAPRHSRGAALGMRGDREGEAALGFEAYFALQERVVVRATEARRPIWPCGGA